MYIKKFEGFIYKKETHLIIVDVQLSFRSFFSEMYINELKKYCNNFSNVYQIFDNHVEGKNVDKDYLYKDNPNIPVNGDLYKFPNQKMLIEKRYNYDVDADFYEKILDEDTYELIKSKESKNQLVQGNIFPTKEGTHIIYIGNNHVWFHLSKKLFNLLNSLKGKNVTIVGGADSECLQDVFISAQSIGVNIKRDWKYIYTSTSCPI